MRTFSSENDLNSEPVLSPRPVRSHSLARRLATALVVTVALVVTLATAFFYLKANRQAEQFFDRKADEMITFLIGTLESPLWNLDEETVRVVCETFVQNELVMSINVREPSGKVFFSTGDQDRPALIRRGRVLHNGELIASVELALEKDLIRKNAHTLLLPFAITTLLVLITLLFFTRFAIRIFLKQPLEQLNDIVNSYGAGHYETPVAPLPYLEFRPLGTVLAEMGHKIQRQVAALRTSEEKYRSIIEKGVEGIFQSSLEGNLVGVNPACARILGYDSPAEMMQIITDLGQQLYVEPGDRTDLLQLLRQKDVVTNYEVRFHKKDRCVIWVELHIRAHRNSEGKLSGLEGFMTDITERREAQERLRASLREKESLLRELYHRTKNNMQVIRAMLTLQAMHSEQPEVSRVFKEMENKIDAMALVHRMLYQSQDLSQINLHDYVHALVELLQESHGIFSDRIVIELAIEPLPVLIDTAIPCGLILNELCTNAFKHAFPEGRKGKIHIRFVQHEEGVTELTFTDDGVGVAPGFDFRKQKTLGLQSIFAIAEHQLQGEIRFFGQQGVSCTLRFRNDLYSSRV